MNRNPEKPPRSSPGTKTKRRSLSKRLRFEVFKRDAFKCQYCGAAAPDVLLTIDHVKPVKGGGDDSLLNLITACAACNGGKAAVPLSDASAVMKQRKELASLAERREQLRMLVEWRDSLATLDDEKVAILEARINERLRPWNQRINETGRGTIRGWIRRFGFESSLHGIAQATDVSSAQALLGQMAQFSAAAAKVAREPELRDYWRIRALLRARCFGYGPEWRPIEQMRRAFRAGRSIGVIGQAASEAEDYEHFLSIIGSED